MGHSECAALTASEAMAHLHAMVRGLLDDFRMADEYELLLAALDDSNASPFHSHYDLLPRHLSVHRPQTRVCDTSQRLCEVGVFGLDESGRVDKDSMLTCGMDWLREAVLPLLSMPRGCRGNRMHTFVLPLPGRSITLYGCVLLVEHLSEPEEEPPLSVTRSTPKSMVSRGKSILHSLAHLSTRQQHKSSTSTPNASHEEASDLESATSERKNTSAGSFVGAFVVSFEPSLECLRQALVDVYSNAESARYSWSEKLEYVTKSCALNVGHRDAEESHVDSAILLSLGTDHLVSLILAVLLEHRIVITSSSITSMVGLAEAVRQCVHPLVWAHTYLPFLPEVYSELLQSPIPYWIGMQKNAFVKHKRGFPLDTFIVDLDLDVCFSSKQSATVFSSVANELRGQIQKIKMETHSDLPSHIKHRSLPSLGRAIVECCNRFVARLVSDAQLFVFKGSDCKNIPAHRSSSAEADILLLDERLFKLYKKDFPNAFKDAFLRTQSFSVWLTAAMYSQSS